MSADEVTPAEEIDAIIASTGGWRAATLAEVRRVILGADAGITEEIKWRKPSKPEGVATWVSNGNVCMADVLKSAVRLTFPKGGQLDDPRGLFNARLTGDKIRAIDFFEDAPVDADALRGIVAQAVAANRG
ncbi:hypothetical protein LK09_18875 [Microbacterium mangrovi]|uniref:YdhG-like domain-containing protein n=1 Tax=Microbacterium mangrovi TaxID=1348253 RepID=A0A0B2A0X6_9MICO|nr:DUF1801 domain-containing protein [Microbacterium mangrovi]KHK95462.1 hypothetical protein LK09_18875 [Microbacterium mangrovi]